jgi:hypothetical protein
MFSKINWKDTLSEAALVGGVAVLISITGIDDMVADMIVRSPLRDVLPAGAVRHAFTFSTVFLADAGYSMITKLNESA